MQFKYEFCLAQENSKTIVDLKGKKKVLLCFNEPNFIGECRIFNFVLGETQHLSK